MTPGERNVAIKDLRRAAERCLRVTVNLKSLPDDLARLERCWREFPECYRDGLPTPSPQEMIAICDRMDRDQEENERFAQALKK